MRCDVGHARIDNGTVTRSARARKLHVLSELAVAAGQSVMRPIFEMASVRADSLDFFFDAPLR